MFMHMYMPVVHINRDQHELFFLMNTHPSFCFWGWVVMSSFTSISDAWKITNRFFRNVRWKIRTTNQENLLESFENLPHHLPHLGYQLEDPERTQAAQHHQQLSPRLRRDVRRQPAQKDQTHLREAAMDGQWGWKQSVHHHVNNPVQ